MADALSVAGVTKRFGSLVVLDDVTIAVGPQERRAIIGPNGSGKSTLFSVIGGQLAPTHGTITVNGRDVTNESAHRRAQLGVARTFQRNNVFGNLSVFENVRLAIQAHRGRIGFFRPITTNHGLLRAADEVLQRVGLEGLRNRPARELAYGDQRRLEIAIAIAPDPAVILIDEPTAGISQAETDRVVSLLKSLPRTTSIVIVEHDMDVVMEVSDRVSVLQNGRILTTGNWSDVRSNALVQEAYLGKQHRKQQRARG